MAFTTTQEFSQYIMTFTHGDEQVLSGAHRPAFGTAEITPGGIDIPIWNTGTVEDISATASTATPNNTLVTLDDFNKRRVVHFLPTEWNRFMDDPNHRKVIADGLARDLVGQALTQFYATVVDEGTEAPELGTTPTGETIAGILLGEIAQIKAKSRAGVPTKLTIFLNASGSAALAQNQRAAFNYAPVGDPMFGNWMGADIWTTDDALSGSGTVVGGIFSEWGIAYASANVEMLAIGVPEPLTGTRVSTVIHAYGLKALDSAQLRILVEANTS